MGYIFPQTVVPWLPAALRKTDRSSLLSRDGRIRSSQILTIW